MSWVSILSVAIESLQKCEFFFKKASQIAEETLVITINKAQETKIHRYKLYYYKSKRFDVLC